MFSFTAQTEMYKWEVIVLGKSYMLELFLGQPVTSLSGCRQPYGNSLYAKLS